MQAQGWRPSTTRRRAAPAPPERLAMSIAKIVEISSESAISFEDAIASGMRRAEESLKNVKGAWISEQKVIADKGAIVGYRVTMRVSFVLA
jgi:dodecin